MLGIQQKILQLPADVMQPTPPNLMLVAQRKGNVHHEPASPLKGIPDEVTNLPWLAVRHAGMKGLLVWERLHTG